MFCYKCKSDKIIYDEYANIYVCENCGLMQTVDEVIIKRDKLKSFMLFALSFLTCIPIINFIVVLCILGSKVKYEYKRMFSNWMLSQLVMVLIIIIACCGLLQGKKDFTGDVVINVIDKASNVFNIEPKMSYDFEVVNIEDNSYVFDRYKSFSNSAIINFDGVKISFYAIRNFVADIDDSGFVYLVQSKKLREQFGLSAYANYGTELLNSVVDESISDLLYIGSINDLLNKPGIIISNSYEDNFYRCSEVGNINYIDDTSTVEIRFLFNKSLVYGICITEV